MRPHPGHAATCGVKTSEAHGLQDFTRDLDFERAVAAGLGRQRDADGVADPLLQQDAERSGRGDDPLRAHARLGEAEMQRVVGALGEHAIDRDEVLHRRDLRGKDDAVALEADLLGARGRKQRRLHHRLAHHRARFERARRGRVGVHQRGQQLLVERAPVGPDAHALFVADRDLDDLRELRVALAS